MGEVQGRDQRLVQEEEGSWGKEEKSGRRERRVIAAIVEAAGNMLPTLSLYLYRSVRESAWSESSGALSLPGETGLGVLIRQDVFRRASLGS